MTILNSMDLTEMVLRRPLAVLNGHLHQRPKHKIHVDEISTTAYKNNGSDTQVIRTLTFVIG